MIPIRKMRATASTSRHLKQNTRFKRNVERCNKFVARYGTRGRDVFSYEWRSAKRILQTKFKRRWMPVQRKMSEVLAAVYRESERAEQDFSAICSRQQPACPIDHDSVNGKEELRNEYLVHMLKPATHYSVHGDHTSINPDGSTETERKYVHFRLIETAHGNERPKRSLAGVPGGSVAHEAPMALLVVFEDRWAPPGYVEVGAPDAQRRTIFLRRTRCGCGREILARSTVGTVVSSAGKLDPVIVLDACCCIARIT